ncbi:galactose oxidase [Prochlorococcus sp. MIT 1306]|uniref:galactose oxidase n=1 Tax=Prochlorococcus sp. MIT 1306 TaxID=1799667 RepID=UPI001E5C09E2|nr:galactose oxidase [Prochlorococcus sp. MIT 1306]
MTPPALFGQYRRLDHEGSDGTFLMHASVPPFFFDPEEMQCMDRRHSQILTIRRFYMVFNHLRYAVGKQCQSLWARPIHQRLIPQGQHLNSKCHQWIIRRELGGGWVPEVA